MHLRNGESPRPKIKLYPVDAMPARAKARGQVEWAVGMFFLLTLAILLCVQLQITAYRATSLYLEDALAASNLASAVIDLEEYGISHTIQIKEPMKAYGLFCYAVKENLNLNEAWENPNNTIISGTVQIADYIVYSVEDKEVTVSRIYPNGQMWQEKDVLGNVRAPNGMLVESTSIYSELSFPVRGLFGTEVEAHKGKLVDVVGFN